MKPHKWAKEIKAWADGAEIECKYIGEVQWKTWATPSWDSNLYEYRIKPQPKRFVCNCGKCNFEIKQEDKNLQPKEPQYVYVLQAKHNGKFELSQVPFESHPPNAFIYIGKIKLETDDGA